jgi:hypothetical protein
MVSTVSTITSWLRDEAWTLLSRSLVLAQCSKSGPLDLMPFVAQVLTLTEIVRASKPDLVPEHAHLADDRTCPHHRRFAWFPRAVWVGALPPGAAPPAQSPILHRPAASVAARPPSLGVTRWHHRRERKIWPSLVGRHGACVGRGRPSPRVPGHRRSAASVTAVDIEESATRLPGWRGRMAAPWAAASPSPVPLPVAAWAPVQDWTTGSLFQRKTARQRRAGRPAVIPRSETAEHAPTARRLSLPPRAMTVAMSDFRKAPG